MARHAFNGMKFIEQGLHSLGVEARCKQRGDDFSFGKGRFPDRTEHLSFVLQMGTPTAWLLSYYSYLKGAGILGMCGIIQQLQSHDVQKLYIQDVRHDGLSFWPWLGAVPDFSWGPDQEVVGEAVEKVAAQNRLDSAAVEILTYTFNLEGMRDEAAWATLTDIDYPTALEKQVIAAVTQRYATDMILHLDSPKVQDRLDKRFSRVLVAA